MRLSGFLGRIFENEKINKPKQNEIYIAYNPVLHVENKAWWIKGLPYLSAISPSR